MGSWLDREGTGEPEATRESAQQSALPVWQCCVFVDWHGVLSEAVFWESILSNEDHELRSPLGGAVDHLFQHQTELVERWMRGTVSMNYVVDRLEVKLSRRYRSDFLTRRLVDDCTRMEPRMSLLEVLHASRADYNALVTLATDNMDCFAAASRRGELSDVFDGILCSSELGVLKSEDPERFFGRWLDAHGLAPADAILVDDSARNCSRFERWGGTAIHFSDERVAFRELQAWVQQQDRP